MEKIVKLEIFTDEQKVSVMKAVVEKKITLNNNSTFEKNGDYYFIKDYKGCYSHVMTFAGGFEYMYFGSISNSQFILDLITVKFPIVNAVVALGGTGFIIAYNKDNMFPLLCCNGTQTNYYTEGASKNTEFIKKLFVCKTVMRSIPYYNFIEYAAKNDIDTSEIKIDNLCDITVVGNGYKFIYYDKSTHTHIIKKEEEQKETKIEKDEFMLLIDKLEDSATMKKNIDAKKVAEYKLHIITQINSCIKKTQNHCDIIKTSTFNQPEITEFLKYISDTKGYTITPSDSYFRIQFF